jgi:outer membrane protein assembly factor BamB
MKARLYLILLLPALLLAPRPRAAALPYEWPQWRGTTRDGVWQQPGLVAKFASSQLKPRWRVPLGGGYCGPTVGGGRVFVMDRLVEPAPQERVHCLDWKTGRHLWTYAYECDYAGLSYADGPRASVTVSDGRAYALGAMGHLHCFRAATGDLLWSKDLRKQYQVQLPMWGIAAAPLIEGDLVIFQIGGKDSCLVALDRKTGAERWHALPDKASYSAPIIIDQAGKRVLVCVTGDRIVGVDPQSGQLYWEYPFPAHVVVISIATPVVSGDRLFVTNFYEGCVMLRLLTDRPAVEKLWQRRGANERQTDGLQSIISTPLMLGDYVYGVDAYGELRCLDAKTGDRLWESLDAVPRNRWATIHFVRNGDKIWMFNERGQLIIAQLSPKGYREISRAQLIKPTLGQLPQREGVCWSHPAYAYRHVFARNDEELLCASLAAPGPERPATRRPPR